MYVLSVHTPDQVIDYPLREKSLKNIKINAGGATNWIIATPSEFYSVPSTQLWCVKDSVGQSVSGVELIRDSSTAEELEALAKLLREGLAAAECPFSRVGTAKSLLEKINVLIKETGTQAT
jgi:hypothetical protein